MKKILLATLEFPPHIGGIASYVDELASALDQTSVIVYAPHEKGDKEYDAQKKYKIYRKKQLFLPLLWPRWVRGVFQMRSIIKKEKIEVVLVNHVLPLGYVAWIIRKIIKVPYIIISHGTDVAYATRSAWKKKWLQKVVKGAEQIIFNSESLKRRFLEGAPEFEGKSTVMYPCPDDIFKSMPAQEKMEELRRTLALQGKKVILSVGRLDEGKGFPHMIRVLDDILAREPHTVWILIGDGPKREELLKEIQDRSLQNVVRYIGPVPHSELPVYYYLADLFVLLTHPDNGREEGLGLVFLEAASAGLPVVAGKSGGVEEAVVQGSTGAVLDVYHEAQKVGDVICELLSDEKKRKELGRNGRKRIDDIFDWNIQLDKLKPWIR